MWMLRHSARWDDQRRKGHLQGDEYIVGRSLAAILKAAGRSDTSDHVRRDGQVCDHSTKDEIRDLLVQYRSDKYKFTAEEGGKIVSAPVEDFKCERTPLRDALDLLAKVSKQEIVVDWPSMSLVGVSKRRRCLCTSRGCRWGRCFGC